MEQKSAGKGMFSQIHYPPRFVVDLKGLARTWLHFLNKVPPGEFYHNILPSYNIFFLSIKYEMLKKYISLKFELKSQPQVVLRLLSFFENFQPQCSYKKREEFIAYIHGLLS